MEQFLFVLTAVISVLFALRSSGLILGYEFTVPLPFLHHFNVDAGNTYLSTPSVAYQIYFWSSYAGIFN